MRCCGTCKKSIRSLIVNPALFPECWRSPSRYGISAPMRAYISGDDRQIPPPVVNRIPVSSTCVEMPGHDAVKPYVAGCLVAVQVPIRHQRRRTPRATRQPLFGRPSSLHERSPAKADLQRSSKISGRNLFSQVSLGTTIGRAGPFRQTVPFQGVCFAENQPVTDQLRERQLSQ